MQKDSSCDLYIDAGYGKQKHRSLWSKIGCLADLHIHTVSETNIGIDKNS